MNILTYTLQLNDKMSAVLKKVGASSDSTTQDVRELKGEVENLNKVNLGGFFSKIGKIASVLGLGVVLGKTIKNGIEQEMRNVSFEVLFGGADNAKRMIDEISGYAAKSPYGKAELSEVTQMMAGFGIAQDKIMPNMKAIGDIAMGDVNKFKSLSLAFSQMSSAGKLMGQDLLQMINAGFNPLAQMSKTTGRSISQLKDDMSKGIITAEMVTNAFHDATQEGGLYHNMIDRINGTVSGQWSMAMDSISEKLLNVYDKVLQPLLLPALKLFNKFLDEAVPKIEAVMNSLSSKIASIVNVIKQNSEQIKKIFQSIFDPVFSFIRNIRSSLAEGNLIIWLKNIKSLIIEHVVPAVEKLWKGLLHIISALFDFISKSELLKDIFAGLVDFGKFLFDAIGWVVDKLVWVFDNVVLPILKGIDKAYRWIKGGSLSNESVAIIDATKSTNAIITAPTITPPQIPGVPDPDTAVANSLTNGRGGGNAGADTANSIATGGSKTTHITINLGELVGTINIAKNGFRESAENMRDMVLDEMTRVLSMAQGQI